MGGLGSGRPSGSGRAKVESCRSLDVNRLHREGCLRSGWTGAWQWTRDGQRVASISLRTDDGVLYLTYRVSIGGGDWEDIGESVRIVRIACRYGGARPLFHLSGRRERQSVRAVRRQSVPPWTIFRLPPLQSAGLPEPERVWPRSRAASRQQDQATSRRRPWNGLAVSEEAKRHVVPDI